MFRFVFKRLILLIPIMLCVSLLAFSLVRAMPGDAASAYLVAAGIPPSDAATAAVNEKLGLDQPFFVQYYNWMIDVLHFDFGNSFINKKPVGQELIGCLSNTMQLALTAMLMVLTLSVPLGFLSARNPNGIIDNVGRVFAFIGCSMPSFWLGFLLVQLFSLKLGILPVSGMGNWEHLILPSLTLSVLYIATYSRVLRNSLLENMNKRFVMYSRARGISEKRVFGTHVFRTSLIPTVTTLGVNFGHMLAGTVIIEVIFSWPGAGRLIVESITARDFPMIQGFIIVMALLFIVINLITDIICAALDPRIRMDG
jgi:nickel ABC transporter permease subunit NikB